MKRTVVFLVFVLATLTPAVAGAGGWAVPSLDPLPTMQAGQTADVGFRLLQHGRTPVVASEWPGATIGLAVRAGDREWFVPAKAGPEPGHYVATIEVPSGIADLDIAVQMRNGLFVEEGWAQVPVAAAATGGGGGDGWLPTWSVPLFALVAVACAALILVDLQANRRRRDDRVATTPTTTPPPTPTTTPAA
jgi:hypothetical protein